MAKDLTVEIQAVFAAQTLDEKKSAMRTLIERSVAKPETKSDAYRTIEVLQSKTKLDFFAFNYMASGEGMKVR
jgi:hypothetical protein